MLPKARWHELDGLAGDLVPRLDPDKAVAFVAEDKGRIVGRLYVIWQPIIQGIWVDPAYQGQGVAIALERAIESGMRALGITKIFVNTNGRLEKWLRRLGFDNPKWTHLEKVI